MTLRGPLRLFLDSNVLTGGIVAPWGLDKAVLSLCAARICRLVLAEVVQLEVEENLLHHAAALPPPEAEQVLADYRHAAHPDPPGTRAPAGPGGGGAGACPHPARCGRPRAGLGGQEPTGLAPDPQYRPLHSGGRPTHRPPDCHAPHLLPGFGPRLGVSRTPRAAPSGVCRAPLQTRFVGLVMSQWTDVQVSLGQHRYWRDGDVL